MRHTPCEERSCGVAGPSMVLLHLRGGEEVEGHAVLARDRASQPLDQPQQAQVDGQVAARRAKLEVQVERVFIRRRQQRPHVSQQRGAPAILGKERLPYWGGSHVSEQRGEG